MEVGMQVLSLSLNEALRLALENIKPLPAEDVALIDSVDRVAVSDLFALVDSPYMDSSLKDGYGVLCADIVGATAENPAQLRVLGSMAAGGEKDIQIRPGTTVRVLTGARLPSGADAVVADEFVKREKDEILIAVPVRPGKNVLQRGSDVAFGQRVLQAGQQISPGMAGLLAAAGHSVVPVFKSPVVGIMGTGDEIVEPGKPLAEGKLYASNMVTLAGWCNKYKMRTRMKIARDDYDVILAVLKELCATTDAVITSGGAWTGDHDYMARVLEGLGWKQVFHRIRIGPGKAVGFGILDKKPIFILAGGPPSNLMGFLQIALPGLLLLSGQASPSLPVTSAVLGAEIKGREPGWTDFFFGALKPGDQLPIFYPMKQRSRLSSMAEAAAVASLPEEIDSLPKGSTVLVQLLK
jgi:molybdopterin molybdotransferase